MRYLLSIPDMCPDIFHAFSWFLLYPTHNHLLVNFKLNNLCISCSIIRKLQNHTHHSLGAYRLIAAVWSETRTRGQVLLNAAIDPRTEMKLYMKPVKQKWNT